MKKKRKPRSIILSELVSQSRGVIGGVFVFSFFLNLLTLVVPLYLLQLYDRVIPNRSIDTLYLLTAIVVIALAVSSALEIIRYNLLARAGTWMEARFGGRVLDGVIEKTRQKGGSSVRGLRDMNTIRKFFSGSRLIPLLDVPWSPLFIIVLYMLHPLVGTLVLIASVILIGLAILNEVISRTPAKEANDVNVDVLDDANAMVRNADAISAMGMRHNVIQRWQESNSTALDLHQKSVNRSRWLTASAKFIRLILQVSVMFTAAWLIVDGQMSAGGLIACVLLMRRAVSPLEGAIGSWKSVINVRGAIERVDEFLAARYKEKPTLQEPRGRLTVDDLRFYHPNALKPVLRRVEFKVSPGEAVAIVGTTGAGKSTLARLLVGNAKPYRGHVYWGEIDVSDWEPEDLGPHIGYLPQTVALFNGTVAENIARMGEFEPGAVMDAAEMSGADEIIRALPEGYDTQIGIEGVRLSGGQQQRIGLARAVYGNPRLVVLDEPDAHLDRAGRKALSMTIANLKDRDAMVILITHQVKLGSEIDRIIELQRGKAVEITASKSSTPRTKLLT